MYQYIHMYVYCCLFLSCCFFLLLVECWYFPTYSDNCWPYCLKTKPNQSSPVGRGPLTPHSLALDNLRRLASMPSISVSFRFRFVFGSGFTRFRFRWVPAPVTFGSGRFRFLSGIRCRSVQLTEAPMWELPISPPCPARLFLSPRVHM